jgi:hypothetical protein
MSDQQAKKVAVARTLRREGAKGDQPQPWKRLQGVAVMVVVLALSACAQTTTSSPRAFTPPAGWLQINAQEHFAFWIPSALSEEHVQGTDSYVGQWSGAGLCVKFDYGMYSGGIDSTIQALPHTEVSDSASGRAGTIITYTDDGAHIATLYVPQVNEQDRLTFTAGKFISGTPEVPLTIVKSVRFL